MQNDLNDIESAGSSIEPEATPDNINFLELLKRLELSNVDGKKSELEREKSELEREKSELDRKKSELGREKSELKNAKLREEVENIKADRELRKKYADQIITFLIYYSIGVALFLLLSGVSICGFTLLTLPEKVLVTLAGSTAVAAIGLVGFIAKGLFNQPK